jgi:hypothetical protein
MTETLQKIEENRDKNKKLLKQKKSLIIKQISAAKSKVLKYLDEIEERLITEVESVQEKHEEKINKEKHDICLLTSILKDNKQELEFVKKHGSNNQLFLTLRKQITIIQKTDKKIHDMSSAINEIDMEFKEIKNVNIETIGSLSQITRPCPIKYKSMKAQHQQVEVDRSQTLTEFIKEGRVNLKRGVQYDLTDMAVTSDNKLLLCNYDDKKVYIYKDYKTYEDEISLTSEPWGITVVPCTDKAVVTLPDEESIQFINTTNNTKDNKINIGEEGCHGVTAVKDKIYIGGEDKVIILNIDGSLVRKIATHDGYNYNLLYNERNDQLLLRQDGKRLCCINLDGHVIYRYDISGHGGLAVDQQGHVYISGRHSHDIHRLSPDGTFRDIVLSKHDGVDGPRNITFNNDFTKLFIINEGGESVLVYSCK